MQAPSICSRNAEDVVVPAAQLSPHLGELGLMMVMAAHDGLPQYPSRWQRDWHSLLPLRNDREDLVFQCS